MRKFNFVASPTKHQWYGSLSPTSIGLNPGSLVAKMKMRPTNISGFKKRLFNQIIARGYTLYPIFNRRKHHHTYQMVVNNQLINLGKAFSYFSKNKIGFYIGSALKTSYIVTPFKRTIPNLIYLIETDTARLLTQNQQFFSLRESRQYLNHSKSRRKQIVKMEDAVRFSGLAGRRQSIRQDRWIDSGNLLRLR